MTATGSRPLSYQWQCNETNLPGATSSALMLTNVQTAQAGNYHVVVTNAFGVVTSSNALLTVIPSIPIPDPNLEAALRSALNRPTGALTHFDFEKLTYLSASYGNITNLASLEWATNLTSLYLPGNSISNVTVLAGLSILQSLTLYYNRVSDLSVLATLTNLSYLELSYNPLTNLAPLGTLTNLTSLYLNGNSVSNLTFLQGLHELSSLRLYNNRITDISLLAGLTNLSYLDLGYNPAADFAQLGGFTNLTSLYINDNSISNITFLHGLVWLTTLDLQNNELQDLTPLAALTNLAYLYLTDNPGADFTQLNGLSNLTDLYISGNSVSNLVMLSDLPRLRVLECDNNKLQDLSGLSSLTNLVLLSADYNRLTNITTLEDLPRLRWVHLVRNLLDTNAGSADMRVITNLQSRGVSVSYVPQNQPPNISVRTNWVVLAGRTSSLTFSVSDDLTSRHQLLVSATSSNPDLLADTHLVVSREVDPDYGYVDWELRVTPASNRTGIVTITLLSTDDTALSASIAILVTVVMPEPFGGEWVNCTNLVWRTWGDAPWFGQTNVAHDATSAAQCGSVGRNGESLLETTVVGPGVLSFWWRTSEETDYWPGGIFTASMDDSGLEGYAYVIGTTNWQKKTVSIPAGKCSLQWQPYTGSSPFISSSNILWLDEVSFRPGPTVSWLEIDRDSVYAPPFSELWLLLHGDLGGIYEFQTSLDLVQWSVQDRMVFSDFETWIPVDAGLAHFYRLRQLPTGTTWLDPIVIQASGGSILRIHGQPGRILRVDASTNLIQWTTLTTLTNQTGTVEFLETALPSYPQRFYRVVSP